MNKKDKPQVRSTNTTYQPIGVVGVVTITKKTSSGTVLRRLKHRNTITKRMATGIVTFLYGALTGSNASIRASQYLPSYIGVGDFNSYDNGTDFDGRYRLGNEYKGSDTSEEPYRYPITSKEYNTTQTTYASVSFRTFISSGDLSDGYEIKELGLYSDATGDTLLARVQLEDEDIVTKDPGTGIDILWNVIIAPGNDQVLNID